jgi:hypothetical protein
MDRKRSREHILPSAFFVIGIFLIIVTVYMLLVKRKTKK